MKISLIKAFIGIGLPALACGIYALDNSAFKITYMAKTGFGQAVTYNANTAGAYCLVVM